MLKILPTSILKEFWSTLLLVFFIFISLTFVVDVLDQLEHFMSRNLPFSQYLLFYGYTVPDVVVTCLPVAIILSVIRLFRRLSVSNEYLALIMAGISLRRIFFPIMMSGLFLSALSFYLVDQVLPNSNFQRKLMRKEKFKGNYQILKQVSLTGTKGRHYYLNHYHQTKRFVRDFMMTEMDGEGRLMRRVFADTLEWKEKHWEAKGVKVQPYGLEGLPEKPSFETIHLFHDIMKPESILVSKNHPQFLGTRDLKKLIHTLPVEKQKLRKKWWVDYHRKFAGAAFPFIVLFVGVPFGISHVRDASSRSAGIGVILSLLYYIVDALFCQAGKGQLLPPFFAAWITNGIFFLAGMFFLQRAPR